jgi:hypothetical protein
MDYVTRQFIVLAKKLHKELRKALFDLRYALQQQTEAIREAQKRENKQQEPEQPPIVVQAELHVPENIERDRKTHEDRQHRLQVWIVIGTWAAFVVAAIYAYVSWGIWQETAHQATIAGIAAREARSAGGRADLRAQSQSQEIEKQFQLDQRPFVIATCCRTSDLANNAIPPTIGKPLGANIEVHNIGRSPAFNFVSHYHLLAGDDVATVRADAPDMTKSEGILPQGGPGIFVTAPYVKDTYTVDVSHIDPSEVLRWDGRVPIIVFGRITYDDTFGNHYCTPFVSEWFHDQIWADIPGISIINTKTRRSRKMPNMCPSQMPF